MSDVRIRRPVSTKDFQTDKAIQLLYEEIRKLKGEIDRIDNDLISVEESIDDVTFITLQDSNSIYWKVTLSESGVASTTVTGASALDVVVLEDSGTTKWDLSISITGVLILTSGSSGTVIDWILTTSGGKDYKLGVTTSGNLTTTLQ